MKVALVATVPTVHMNVFARRPDDWIVLLNALESRAVPRSSKTNLDTRRAVEANQMSLKSSRMKMARNGDRNAFFVALPRETHVVSKVIASG